MVTTSRGKRGAAPRNVGLAGSKDEALDSAGSTDSYGSRRRFPTVPPRRSPPRRGGKAQKHRRRLSRSLRSPFSCQFGGRRGTCPLHPRPSATPAPDPPRPFRVGDGLHLGRRRERGRPLPQVSELFTPRDDAGRARACGSVGVTRSFSTRVRVLACKVFVWYLFVSSVCSHFSHGATLNLAPLHYRSLTHQLSLPNQSAPERLVHGDFGFRLPSRPWTPASSDRLGA